MCRLHRVSLNRDASEAESKRGELLAKVNVPLLVLASGCVLISFLVLGKKGFNLPGWGWLDGNLHSFESKNYPNHFISVREFSARIAPANNPSEFLSSTFRILPGLVTGKDFVSFESKEYPDHYLRHQDFKMKLHRNDGSDLFKKGATFKKVEGLADLSASSFESVDCPDHFIRHQNWSLWIHKRENGELYREDSTFRIVSPLTAKEKTRKMEDVQLDPDRVAYFQDHKYIFVPQQKKWKDAEMVAKEMGGHLVSITSQAEQEFIVGFIRNQPNASFASWLGLTDDEKEGEWKWITGEELQYTSWIPGQPDNGYGCQNHAWIGWSGNGDWDDGLEGYTLPFIVEFEKGSELSTWDKILKSFGRKQKPEKDPFIGRWKWHTGEIRIVDPHRIYGEADPVEVS